MQIIGITGSKRDLGKAIFDELTEDYHIESYNYPDFDLNDIETRKWIIEDIQNLDITIFINNSYADGGQTLLLYDLINLINSGYELQVITLNSINSTREFNDIQRLDQLKYTIDKGNIDKIHEYYSEYKDKGILKNIHLPMCDTSYNIHKIEEKLSKSEVVKIIRKYI